MLRDFHHSLCLKSCPFCSGKSISVSIAQYRIYMEDAYHEGNGFEVAGDKMVLCRKTTHERDLGHRYLVCHHLGFLINNRPFVICLITPHFLNSRLIRTCNSCCTILTAILDIISEIEPFPWVRMSTVQFNMTYIMCNGNIIHLGKTLLYQFVWVRCFCSRLIMMQV